MGRKGQAQPCPRLTLPMFMASCANIKRTHRQPAWVSSCPGSTRRDTQTHLRMVVVLHACALAAHSRIPKTYFSIMPSQVAGHFTKMLS